MKKSLLLSLLALLLLQISFAQNKAAYFKVALAPNSSMPAWTAEMYSSDPNVFRVDSLYQQYYRQHSFVKNTHSQNYKHWRRFIATKLDENGYIRPLSASDENRLYNDLFSRWQTAQQQSGSRAFSGWNCIGPFETYSIGTGATRSTQVNIYCMSQAATNANILFAGTEGGGVFKSTDKGLNWTYMTATLPVNSVSAIEIDPTNANIVYFSGNNRIYKTIDGGLNWTEINNPGGNMYEFLIDPSNNQKIFAVGEVGLLKSTNAGANWTTQFSAECWDIDFMPGSVDTIYLLKNNAAAKVDEFFRSDDGGATWNLKNNGYYTPTVFAEASAIGGKIAVSPAAPRMVYVALIGDSKANDDGWIGLYRSNNAGDNWSNPSGYVGGPYNASNPYMVGYSDGYHQGFYNFDLEVSDINPAKIWIGAIFLWTSADSGQSFQQISPHPHADHQDLDVNGTDIWIATDGGLELSTDELVTFESRKNGITGSEYWRLGSGWNEDILVGGRYHNGDAALFMPNYGAGQSLFLGAAEEGTGYLNPLNNRISYFSDLGASPLLPLNLTGSVNYLPALGLYPNEGYTLRRSELVFDCRYADIMYMGNDNQFWKSTDGGANFTALYNFGANATTMEIEQSRSNPAVIYVSVYNNSNSNSTKGEIYKTSNGGSTWTKLPDLPTTYRRELQLAINPENADELWVGNTYGSNGQKVYRTIDGGATWQNKSTATLNGEEMRDLMYQPAVGNDLVYVATYYGVFYWDATLNDWVNMSTGMPYIINTNEMQPFFRDGKLRLATFGRAVWEAGLAADVRPQAQPITQSDTLYCVRDTAHFDCYSIINHSGSSWAWSFSPAPLYISDSTVRNPAVVFGAAGSYSVTLRITDGAGRSSSKSVPNMVTVVPACSPDTIPGLALQCIDGDDYGQTGNFNINTNVLTISAWVKPNGIQDDYTGIVMNDGTDAAGFNFRGGNNSLGYHWPGGQWWWNSGLIVPANEWSHVAMVATANSITLYVNGKAASQTISLSPVDISTFKIGSYRAWAGRNFNGLIDEVCIWNRALTTTEIRALRHLTKENQVANDPSLLAYYQFNESLNQSTVTDNAGIYHLSLSNGATLGHSTAPVGSGSSESATVSAAGQYSLADAGIDLHFGTNHPNGEIWATKIRLAPDSLPASTYNGFPTYWILNNYGVNTNFAIDSLRLYPLDYSLANAVLSNPSLSELYVRNAENAFLNNWAAPCSGTAAASNYVQFDACAAAGRQFFLTADNTAVPVIQTATASPTVFPNPANSGQHIFVSGVSGKVRFKLFGSSGKLIKDTWIEIPQEGSFIDLPELSEGIYFYSIESSRKMFSASLVVKR